MTEPVSLIRARPNMMAVGKPLPQAVYDSTGKLLLASGLIIANQSQLDGLLKHGFFRDTDADAGRGMPAHRPVGTKKRSSPPPPPDRAETTTSAVIVNMDEVRWHVGESLYLQLQDNPAIRYTVRLIGFVKNKTVFVTAPTLDGKFELIRDGQTFVVRAFSGKKVYAFTAAAVKSVHTPHPYLHLTYPKQVRFTTVRQSARVHLNLIAAVSLDDPERVGAAVMIDLSPGGASCVMKEVLGKKGDQGLVKFRVNVADQESYLSLNAVLRSVSPSENGDGYKHGFEFVNVSAQERLILSAFVHIALVEAA